ncbi:UBX domain-containing protein 4 isoform X2 [Microcaecilia unicolor]|nr:UBX domain-containing protein 4 isoform X2 [Microcaecilia unicolor]
MAASWENEKVAEAVAEGFVAIKIDTKSEACLQFSQIYPVVCIPSSFFIGDSGIPLEVIAGSVSAEELIARIYKVTQMRTPKNEVPLHNQNQSSSLPSIPCPSFESASTSESSQPTVEQCCESHPPLCETEMDAPADEEHSGQKSSTQEATNISLDGSVTEGFQDKVERITKKLEERQEQKKKDEEQREIKKEIERRKTGKDMLEFKRRQEEDLAKRMLEERNREKAEEKAARERIKQQIALDRAERAARFAKSQEEAEALKAAALQAQQIEIEARKEAALKERSAIARIQFRLPDGSSFTNQFPSESLLEEARQFAAKTVGNTYGNFTLATMFPRREFTEDDYRKTLQTLELAPSASVVLLPAGRPSMTVVQSSDGGLLALLGTIFYPFLAVWRFLSNFLFASPHPTQTKTRTTYRQENPQTSASIASEPKRETVRKRVSEKRGDEFKKEGKIYRLRTQDDDDENNTWNGNSTQQM